MSAIAPLTGARLQIVTARVFGWPPSRGTQSTEKIPPGYKIHVGLPGHLERNALPRIDHDVIYRLIQERRAPGTRRQDLRTGPGRIASAAIAVKYSGARVPDDRALAALGSESTGGIQLGNEHL